MIALQFVKGKPNIFIENSFHLHRYSALKRDNHPRAISKIIIKVNPTAKPMVPILL